VIGYIIKLFLRWEMGIVADEGCSRLPGGILLCENQLSGREDKGL
jgi:hypothetical protein